MLMALGRAFNVTIVAEGVETTEQLERLEALGCEHAQGFFLEKPLVTAKVRDAVNRIEARTFIEAKAAKGSTSRSRTRDAAHR
jgi:EAL domain-containing protein (putative c-di-GMP-specific phosphodiesterase class I)